mgnify:CR=1 FL=1
MSYVEFKNVSKTYKTGDVSVEALKDASFEIGKGEICVIVGQSGAGKTTLLNILGGMDRLTEGEVYLDGTAVSDYNKKQLATYRRRDIGFVFQFYNLIPSLTVRENVALTKSIVKDAADPDEMLAAVGLANHKDKFPSQLSGGEQQRVSIARALSKKPRIILGDEPTGALDSETGVIVLSLLQKQSRDGKNTVILVTHNADIAQCADKVIRMKNGKIREVITNEHPLAVEEVEW